MNLTELDIRVCNIVVILDQDNGRLLGIPGALRRFQILFISFDFTISTPVVGAFKFLQVRLLVRKLVKTARARRVLTLNHTMGLIGEVLDLFGFK